MTLITVTVICTLSLLESLQLAYNHEGMESPSCETVCALRQLPRSIAGMSFSQLPSPVSVLPRLEELDVTACKFITPLSPLGSLALLTRVTIQGCPNPWMVHFSKFFESRVY